MGGARHSDLPTPSQVRAVLPPDCTKASTPIAMAIFGTDLVLYGLTFAGILLAPSLWAKAALSVCNGFAVGIHFIIGHDSCHGSFTPHRWLNATLGRMSFMVSVIPFTSWTLLHNKLHHGRTNLRGSDPVWTPLSHDDYRQLPVWRRRLERIYRSAYGLSLNYAIEYWWKRLMFPSGAFRNRLSLVPFWLDRLSVLAFLSAQVILLAAFGRAASLPVLVLLGILVPQAIFWWLLSCVTYIQHTHPDVRWFDDPEEWSFFASQVQGTVRVALPGVAGTVLFHNVLEHTAHHVDQSIPIYRLAAAQRTLDETFPGNVVQYPFTFRHLHRITATCQLYDYRAHRWLDFSGRPTTRAAAPVHRGTRVATTRKLGHANPSIPSPRGRRTAPQGIGKWPAVRPAGEVT
jgi:omega-6 fatty acid desaturase (delta-12 desaturase)